MSEGREEEKGGRGEGGGVDNLKREETPADADRKSKFHLHIHGKTWTSYGATPIYRPASGGAYI